MSKLTFFPLLLALAIFSCVKPNDNPSLNSTTNHTEDADYRAFINPALLVGKWQLTTIGTVTMCPEGHTLAEIWVKTTTNEILDFKNTGEFTKEGNNDALCKGSFQITNGHLITKSNCSVEANIRELTETVLIFETQDKLTRLKYTKL